MAYRTGLVAVGGVGLGACLWVSAGCNCGSDPAFAPDTETEGDSLTSGTTVPATIGEEGTASVTLDGGSSTTFEPTSITAPVTLDPSTSSGGDYLCGDGDAVPGELCFLPPSVVLSATSTASVLLADFDGDEILDLAAGHDGAASVRYGVGDGTFGGEVEITSMAGILGLAAADFNDDDLVDLAIADSGADQILVLLSVAGGAFAPAVTTGTGSGPRGIAVADFDDDLLPDLAIPNEGGGEVQIMAGDGAGGFTPLATLDAGTAPFASDALDIDGSNGPDVVVANFGSSSLGVFLQTSSGFAREAGYLAQGGPRSVVLADFDDDGAVDLASVHQDGDSAGFFAGMGDGSFANGVFIPTAANPRAAVAADLDHDGVPDLAAAMETGNAVSILRGDATEGLLAPESFPTMSSPTAIAAGDLDDDGAIDIVTGSPGLAGGIAVLLADP